MDAFANYGFDSLKADGCSTELNVSLWASLMANTQQGSRVVFESCHNGPAPSPGDNLADIPYHFFRSSTDIRNTYGSTVNNAQSVRFYQQHNLTGPGVWAYPDMTVVGVSTSGVNPPIALPTHTEWRAHFSLWCVVSSPLILSLDLRNAATVDGVWDIISNSEAIAVNQAWGGAPGGVLYESTQDNVTLQHCTWPWAHDINCTLPRIQQWWKPLPGGAVGVLVMNHGDTTVSSTVSFSALPSVYLPCAAAGSSCHVRDINAHADLGTFTGSYTVNNLASHDVAFLLIQ